MLRIAMINPSGLVYNVAAWDGQQAWTPHTPEMIQAGWKLFDATHQPEVSPGWTYDGTVFTAPASDPNA